MAHRTKDQQTTSKSHKGYTFDTSTYVVMKMDVRRDSDSGRLVSKPEKSLSKKEK